jgi:hypothetical protein
MYLILGTGTMDNSSLNSTYIPYKCSRHVEMFPETILFLCDELKLFGFTFAQLKKLYFRSRRICHQILRPPRKRLALAVPGPVADVIPAGKFPRINWSDLHRSGGEFPRFKLCADLNLLIGYVVSNATKGNRAACDVKSSDALVTAMRSKKSAHLLQLPNPTPPLALYHYQHAIETCSP